MAWANRKNKIISNKNFMHSVNLVIVRGSLTFLLVQKNPAESCYISFFFKKFMYVVCSMFSCPKRFNISKDKPTLILPMGILCVQCYSDPFFLHGASTKFTDFYWVFF